MRGRSRSLLIFVAMVENGWGQSMEWPCDSDHDKWFEAAFPTREIRVGRGVGTRLAGVFSVVFIGVGSFGFVFAVHGDVRRHLRISEILMESRHSVADGDEATNQS